MGCCQSKLLGIQTTSQKYQSSAIVLNSKYISPPKQKQLAIIELANQESQKQNTNRCSIGSLNSNLQYILQAFQNQKGPITYTFLDKQPQLHDNSLQICTNNNENNQEISHLANQLKNSFSNTDFNSSKDELNSQDQISDFFQNNTNILSNASIKTKRQLQKQLFYINSSQLGTTKLLKWVEEDRTILNLNQKQLFQCHVSEQQPALIAALLLICYYEQKYKLRLLALKQLGKGVGVRVFINGIKRMLKLEVIEKRINSIIQNVLQVLKKMQKIQVSNWVYVLTGWIPQCINLTAFPDTNQIFKRLIRNYSNGNLIISFENSNSNEFLLVKEVNMQLQAIKVTRFQNSTIQTNLKYDCQEWLSWTTVSNQYQKLNVNWNPLIYSFAKKVEGLSTASKIKDNTFRSKPTYLIEIPPSKSEVQVRLLIQVHQMNEKRYNNFQINLYQHQNNFFVSHQQAPIRSATSNNPIFLSQIFIFQKCDQPSQYVLRIDLQNQDRQYQEEIQITIDFYTFCQINIKTMKQPKLMHFLEVQSKMSVHNAGFGMNSPFFNRNLHYSLFFGKDGICKINVKTETKSPIMFELCLLPDTNNYKDITLIRPQQLVKDIIQSQQFESEGIFQFQYSKGYFILMLVCFTPTQGLVKINMQTYTHPQKQYQIQGSSQFKIKQIQSNFNFMQQIEFEWKSSSPGPRKRTKSNCDFVYYPINTFDRFFENPYIDYILPKGLYQFSIISKTFQANYQFQQTLNSQDNLNVKILSAQPSSLSMGIYQLNENKTQAKIVLDDYQYVPYGIGFWTGPLQLEGEHRFVFSKMERGKQTGVFRIRKIGNN